MANTENNKAQTTETLRLQDLLQFYQTAGVEDAVQNEAFNALAAPVTMAVKPVPRATFPKQPPKATTASAASNHAPKQAHITYENWCTRAREQATAAHNLTELKEIIAAFDGCTLKRTAKNTCIADGNTPCTLMLIGEGPGAEEDRQALPFVGPAGQLLNLMLAAIGFTRESLQKINAEKAASPSSLPLAYITNAVFWRPPGNRNPTPEEMALCRPFLQRQIELVRPKILISLGAVAASSLLERKESILRLRGNWHDYKLPDGTSIPLMPSLHPAYLLRAPLQKKAAWQDFLAAKIRLEELRKVVS